MAWRLARALETLRAQVNLRFPARSKQSDGSIGNAEHSSRESDHNPNGAGVVCAIDITHDPEGGVDSYALAETLLKNQDPRLAYVISNRRIGSGPAGPSPGVWRAYSGKNPHDHHCHVSVRQDASKYDNAQTWDIDGIAAPAPDAVASYVAPPPTLRKGDKGNQVQTMQGRLNAHGDNIKVDGDFGPMTMNALILFQKRMGLVTDGICGPASWSALLK
jgi:hypothetical protein